MRRGFTLVELAFVIAIIALLTAITVPTTYTLVMRARAEEARMTLHAIAHAELQYRRDHGEFLECTSGGTVPTSPSDFSTNECWKQLGIQPEGRVRYRYIASKDGPSFKLLAEGDLDGDNVTSRFVLDGRTMEITVEQELE